MAVERLQEKKDFSYGEGKKGLQLKSMTARLSIR
jgi:hypothetical protein